MAFEGFELSRISLGEIETRVRHGGSGPPLLLLHGCPQTHMMWGKIAGELARDFTVVAPDIRGYGESSKPASTADSAAYSKRAMAEDVVALMQHFGFSEFFVAGHDRGGRIGYRLALDHPERVRRLSVLDIVPTGEVWARADAQLMQAYWHWAFLALPAPQPETLIQCAGGETFFLKILLGGLHDKDFVDPEAYADYARCAADPETVRGICEDYRAGAAVDLRLDEAERGRGKVERHVAVAGVGARLEADERTWRRDGRGDQPVSEQGIWPTPGTRSSAHPSRCSRLDRFRHAGRSHCPSRGGDNLS